jgi:hypothetical protein
MSSTYVFKEGAALQRFRSDIKLVNAVKRNVALWMSLYDINIELSDERLDAIVDSIYEKVDVIMKDTNYVIGNKVIPLAVDGEYILVVRQSDIDLEVRRLWSN